LKGKPQKKKKKKKFWKQTNSKKETKHHKKFRQNPAKQHQTEITQSAINHHRELTPTQATENQPPIETLKHPINQNSVP
jgi:hypothetical protein